MPGSGPLTKADGGFFQLPLELRQEIYFHYLRATSVPTLWMIYRHTRIDNSPRHSPLGAVSKQFRTEVVDVLEKQQNFCYRITSQEASFDKLAISCSRLFDRTLSYSAIPHLTVNIYPPHPDRPIDMSHIWKRVQRFCNDFGAAPIKRALSIHFMEDEIARWSTDGEPHDTLKLTLLDRVNDTIQCDVTYILDLFACLIDVQISIHLPPSLQACAHLQHYAAAIEEPTTEPTPWDQELAEFDCELIADEIEEAESRLKLETGRKSVEKLDAFYDSGIGNMPRISEKTMAKFQEIWPYIDELDEIEPGKYPWMYTAWSIYLPKEDDEWEAEMRNGKPSWL